MKKNQLIRFAQFLRTGKKFALALIFILLAFSALYAKDATFREIQSIQMPFEATQKYYEHTSDFKFFLCSTKEEMLMMDGIAGKILWHINFEKEFKNEKFSNQFWNKTANVVLLFDEDTKKGVATKYFIDGKTGKQLWTSDKYVSDFGQYELSYGFSNYYDEETNSVLLPTKESVDLVDVTTGKTIWTKPINLTGKSKEFNCFIMNYYNLVKIVTGKEDEAYFTTTDGKEVTDIEPYFNKKKFMADRLHATIIDIPDKNMYVLMQGETNRFLSMVGTAMPKWKMYFKGYDAKTNELLWSKQYKIAYTFDMVDYSPLVKMLYSDGKLFVEHEPNLNNNSGLTVLNVDNGEMLWEAYFSTSEIKNSLTKVVLTPFPAPSPEMADGKTFVVNKIKNIVSCYDSETGKKLWDSEKYPDAQKIPTLIAADGLVIMVHGGDAIKCVGHVQSSGPTIYNHEYNNKDKYGIIAYNAATGKVVWSNETIGKEAKDNFGYVAGMELIGDKLFCATDKNFFIIEPKTGNILNSTPVSKEKLGDAWRMFYFSENEKIIVNCDNGIIKIDSKTAKVEGRLEIKNIPYFPPTYSLDVNPLNLYEDYAIIIDGDPEKFKFDKFASIDLDAMAVRGTDDAYLIFDSNDHFGENAEMFYKLEKSNFKIYKVK